MALRKSCYIVELRLHIFNAAANSNAVFEALPTKNLVVSRMLV